VSFLDINFDGLSSAKLCQRRILGLHVVMKKIYNFPEKSELPKFIHPVKISWLILFCGFRGENEKFADIIAGSLSRLAASPLALVFEREPARRLTPSLTFSPKEPTTDDRCSVNPS